MADAQHFAHTFEPQTDGKYGWIPTYAKDQSAYYDATFRDLDDKASALITYVGSGTGLVTFGTVVAGSASGLSPWVMLATLPAIVAAIVAVWRAANVRKARLVFSMPSVRDAIDYAHYFGDRAEAAWLGMWNVRIKQMIVTVESKATDLNRSVASFRVALVLLLLPLAAGITMGLLNPSPKSPPSHDHQTTARQ